MEEDRATPIFMLPGQKQIDSKDDSPVHQQNLDHIPSSSQKEMIKMEIKKKESSCKSDSQKDKSFNITVDFSSLILLVALFLASFLNTSHFGFLPDSMKSNLFIFSITKTLLLFCAIFFLKNYFFVFDEN